jgi:hypothetical protein
MAAQFIMQSSCSTALFVELAKFCCWKCVRKQESRTLLSCACFAVGGLPTRLFGFVFKRENGLVRM